MYHLVFKQWTFSNAIVSKYNASYIRQKFTCISVHIRHYIEHEHIS